MKPGGGGAIGAEYVAKSPADGYTILFGDSGVNSAKPAQSGRSKGPDDMVAICIINYSITPILVRTDAPFKTFKEFMDYARKHPYELKYAAAGAGSWNEMAWKQVEAETGIKTRIIPYEGGAAGMLAVLGGHADITGTGISSAAAHIKAGKLRPILILKENRVKSLPDVPTGKELGINANGTFWKGMVAPKGTPKPIIEKLAQAFKQMSEDPSVVQLIERAGDELEYVGPDEFTKLWRAEYENQKMLYKSAK
jgi:tripartite-type tricarboxylate transporter receptor subunit TctC